jgi:hypothetical protein
MKRFLVIFVVLSLICVVAGAQYPQNVPTSGKNKVLVYYSPLITDPSDTFFIPGYEVQSYSNTDSVNRPNIWGIDISQHRWLGIEVVPIQPDTTLNDSIHVDVFTGNYGNIDSFVCIVPPDSIPYGTIFDTCLAYPDCPRTSKWFNTVDSACVYWFQRYVWLRVRTAITTAFATDTVVTNISPEKDVFAVGDSIHGWTATNGDDSWETEIDEAQGSIDWDDYVSVVVKDSFLVISMDQTEIEENPGTIDSLVFFVVCMESLNVITADSIRAGAMFGDTSKHYFGLIGEPVWGATQVPAEEGAAGTYDTLTFSLPLTPRGTKWTRSNLDSTLMVLQSVFIDTVAAGTAGMIKVPQVWARTYHSRTELFPALKYRATVYLKE